MGQKITAGEIWKQFYDGLKDINGVGFENSGYEREITPDKLKNRSSRATKKPFSPNACMDFLNGLFSQRADCDVTQRKYIQLIIKCKDTITGYGLDTGEIESSINKMTDALNNQSEDLFWVSAGNAMREIDKCDRAVQNPDSTNPIGKTLGEIHCDNNQIAVERKQVHPTGLFGRENEVRSILNHLGLKKIVTVVGAGGIGKTQICLEVCNNYSSKYILYTRGISLYEDLVKYVAKNIGYDPEIESKVAECERNYEKMISDTEEGICQFLSDNCTLTRVDTLVYFDNLEDILGNANDKGKAVAFIEKLAQVSCVKILLSSTINLTGDSILIKELDEDASVQLFFEVYTRKCGYDIECNDKKLIRDRVIPQTGGHPLSIVLYAANAADDLSISDFVNQMSNQERFEVDLSLDDEECHKSLRGALNASWKKIEEDDIAKSVWSIVAMSSGKVSRKVLNECVDDVRILNESLKKMKKLSLIEVSNDYVDMLQPLRTVILELDQRAVKEVKEKLSSYYIKKMQDYRVYQRTKELEMFQLSGNIVCLIKQLILDDEDTDKTILYNMLSTHIGMWEVIKEHLLAMYEIFKNFINEEGEITCAGIPDSALIIIFSGIGYYEMRENGNITNAETLLKKGLKIGTEEDYIFEKAYIIKLLGDIQRKKQNYDKAIEFYSEARNMMEMSQGENWFISAEANHNMGDSYYFLAEYEKAQECFENVREVFRKNGYERGAGHMYESIGDIELNYKKDYKKALEAYKAALNQFSKINSRRYMLKTLEKIKNVMVQGKMENVNSVEEQIESLKKELNIQ